MSRRASAFPVAALALLLTARVSFVLAVGQGGQVPFTVALFVLPLLYAVPWTRPLLSRHRWLVLAAQGVLSWVPFVVFGSAWQAGIGGLLAGLVLLMVPGRLSWLLAGMLMGAEVAVRAGLTGLPAGPAWYGVLYVLTFYVDDALAFFGLVRLAQIVGEMEQARAAAAGLAVARERLRATRELQAAIGERLSDIAAMAATAQGALSRDAARARSLIAAAGTVARDSVEQARQVAARQRAASGPELAVAVGGAVIAARLAWTVLVVVLLGFAIEGVNATLATGYGTRLDVLAITDIALITAVQFYHSRAERAGSRPRAWPVTLGLQAVLVYASFLPSVDAILGGLAPFLAGSVLLLVPGRWRWAGYAAVVASIAVLSATVSVRGFIVLGGNKAGSAIFYAAITAAVGLVVYGLARLAALAARLEALQEELARMAVVRERLRIARDVHDLLGLGLSAIALKADLIGQLIGRDNARAVAEVGELGRICASARADIRLVTGDDQRLALDAELAAAGQVLASAGIRVQADILAGQLPAAADRVLAAVLREAVTNVLRHSAAAVCTIEVSAGDGGLRLRVSNDGVPEPAPAGERSGSGLANLTARVQAVGGHLASSQVDGRFEVLAEIPPAAPAS